MSKSLLDKFIEADWVLAWDEDSPTEMVFYKEFNEAASVTLQIEMIDDIFVRHIEVENLDKKQLRKALKTLPWTTREIILMDYEGPLFVQDFEGKEALVKENASCENLITQ